MLSQAERDRIAAAIASAERGTSGEIVVLVAGRAGAYRSVALALALLCGLAVPWPLILATEWSAGWIAVAQAVTVLGVLAATLHPRARAAIVPRALKRARAHDAAQREFAARGVTRTRARTGILIYLAVAEGHAEIVADHGVVARIPKETWSAAIEALLSGLRRGDAAGGLIAAVDRAGAILTTEFPGEPDDIDELPNRVIVTD
jgi:putative membrane protein